MDQMDSSDESFLPVHFQSLDNALERANEFIDVGKSLKALEILSDVLKSKKHRVWQAKHEEIMYKFLELCITQQKSFAAKEGLYQYKIICQQTYIKSFEDVVRKFLELAEAKAISAKEKIKTIEAISNIDLDDLDSVTRPEEILLCAVSSEDTQDRNEHVDLLPWVKFLWDSYRHCLELLRNNPRTERLYHDIAYQTFQFCIEFNRKPEMRKLSHSLHNHLEILKKLQSNASVSGNQNIINLNNPESQGMHLETRLVQLDSAIQMELWQEAYKATDDIKKFGLMSQAKKEPKSRIMATYYPNLKNLYEWLEKVLNPHQLRKKIQSIILEIQDDKKYSKLILYLNSIKDVASSERRNYLNVRIRHRRPRLLFGTAYKISGGEEVVEGPHIQNSLSDQKRRQLVNMFLIDSNRLRDKRYIGKAKSIGREWKQLEKERKLQLIEQKKIERKIDHFERVKRVEELPLLKQEYEAWKVKDREEWDELEKERLAQVALERELALKHKERLSRMLDDAKKFTEEVQKIRHEVYIARLADWQKRLDEEREGKLLQRKQNRKLQRRRDFILEMQRVAAKRVAEEARRKREEEYAEAKRIQEHQQKREKEVEERREKLLKEQEEYRLRKMGKEKRNHVDYRKNKKKQQLPDNCRPGYQIG